MTADVVALTLWIGLLLALVVAAGSVFTFLQATSARRARAAAESAVVEARTIRGQVLRILDETAEESRLERADRTVRSHPSRASRGPRGSGSVHS